LTNNSVQEDTKHGTSNGILSVPGKKDLAWKP